MTGSGKLNVSVFRANAHHVVVTFFFFLLLLLSFTPVKGVEISVERIDLTRILWERGMFGKKERF